MIKQISIEAYKRQNKEKRVSVRCMSDTRFLVL